MKVTSTRKLLNDMPVESVRPGMLLVVVQEPSSSKPEQNTTGTLAPSTQYQNTTITGFVLAEGLMAAVLLDTLSLTAPRSTAAELRFCSTRYQVCFKLNFQLLELENSCLLQCPPVGGPEANLND